MRAVLFHCDSEGRGLEGSPVDKLSVVLAAGLAFLFLRERLSLIVSLGTLLITVGVIMTAIG
ncbi:EamA family transporter [Paenibacillus thiaminolyticus]|uniref:EamA family transporter n=1 Tax=Paenibacillus thiaminolyticus TaxID=49283 RepID=A0ABT4G4X0_PANTH|nr:EamA family transporter [Paenibacillus thiaminolyticus]MCY9534682.1 EamA family transporter [Paenibacillus thiaminolyticus]MCY9602015.1 EamA family transporter [Paenibacillus thiaminolyticus]MCY9611126.1 EamA family transporter [Paenibacillus thiaminolyticus]MCY9614981.1 EamA family transporter [Paenibacillus thiaminolyticus]MCY9618523.1 EamA family transporter [Paenibacillus thiaminolyticus]